MTRCLGRRGGERRRQGPAPRAVTSGGTEKLGVGLSDEDKKGAGEEGRPEMEAVLADQTGTGLSGIAVAQREENERVEHKHGADDAEEGKQDLGIGEDFLHESENSLLVTIGLLGVLAVCGARGEGLEWLHFAVFGGGYGLLFGVTCWSERRWEDGECGQAASNFLESRLAVLMAGVGALVFGSPGLLELAPDVLAIAGVCGGVPDGSNVGELSKRMRCSWGRALWRLLGPSKEISRMSDGST